jgi:glycosyltransferase domain-containing protein
MSEANMKKGTEIVLDRLFDEFTLIVPTYNRHPFLLRLLGFYESYDFPFRIVVLDSSSDDLESEELKRLLAHKRINYEEFESNTFPDEKIARGLGNVKTPYAALCGDDDFIIPSAVSQCIEFLEQKPDYSCAQGYFIQNGVTSKLKGGQFCWWPLYENTTSNECARAHERVHAYLTQSGKAGGPQFYAVHRSNTLRMIWKESIKYASDYGLGELFSGCMSLICGKRKTLPIFYSTREPHDSSPFEVSDREKWYSSEKLEKAIRGIAIHLQRAEGLESDNAEVMARKSLNAYLDRVFRSKKWRSSSWFAPRILWKVFGIRNSIIAKMYHIKYSRIIEDKSSQFYPDYLKVRDAVLSAGLGQEELNHARNTYQRIYQNKK